LGSYLVISIGAVLGANTRYLMGGWVADRVGSSFPWGTFVINVTGSLVIGLVLGLAADRVMPWWWRPGVAIGFLGAYTTFSTFSYETLNLLQEGSYVAAAANMVGSVAIALIAAFAGVMIARII
jgi:CrcB protein